MYGGQPAVLAKWSACSLPGIPGETNRSMTSKFIECSNAFPGVEYSGNLQFNSWPPHHGSMCDHWSNYSNFFIDPLCYPWGDSPSFANYPFALPKQCNSSVAFIVRCSLQVSLLSSMTPKFWPAHCQRIWLVCIHGYLKCEKYHLCLCRICWQSMIFTPFYCTTCMHSADYAVAGCLSVCHTPVLSLNVYRYPQIFFTIG